MICFASASPWLKLCFALLVLLRMSDACTSPGKMSDASTSPGKSSNGSQISDLCSDLAAVSLADPPLPPPAEKPPPEKHQREEDEAEVKRTRPPKRLKSTRAKKADEAAGPEVSFSEYTADPDFEGDGSGCHSQERLDPFHAGPFFF